MKYLLILLCAVTMGCSTMKLSDYDNKFETYQTVKLRVILGGLK